MPVPSNELTNQHYAGFATTSRLVACLTSESLVPAYFVPSTEQDIIGICLLLRPTCVKEEDVPTSVTLDDILAVVPLRGLPVIDNSHTAILNGVGCPRIDMVDGLDMLAHIYSIDTHGQPSNSSITEDTKQTLSKVLDKQIKFELLDGYDAVQMWDRFATDLNVNGKLKEQIGQELGSSILFQSKSFINKYNNKQLIFFKIEYTYDHPKELPDLNSGTIAWEQSVVEGHATHPVSIVIGF